MRRLRSTKQGCKKTAICQLPSFNALRDLATCCRVPTPNYTCNTTKQSCKTAVLVCQSSNTAGAQRNTNHNNQQEVVAFCRFHKCDNTDKPQQLQQPSLLNCKPWQGCNPASNAAVFPAHCPSKPNYRPGKVAATKWQFCCRAAESTGSGLPNRRVRGSRIDGFGAPT